MWHCCLGLSRQVTVAQVVLALVDFVRYFVMRHRIAIAVTVTSMTQTAAVTAITESESSPPTDILSTGDVACASPDDELTAETECGSATKNRNWKEDQFEYRTPAKK